MLRSKRLSRDDQRYRNQSGNKQGSHGAYFTPLFEFFHVVERKNVALETDMSIYTSIHLTAKDSHEI